MDITAKLWSYCHILRHDGVDYGDYIEQLTYLLFLKMAEENDVLIPKNCRWGNLLDKQGEELKQYYEFILQELQKEKGILGQIFQEPISKIKNPSSLKKIIDGIESVGWMGLDKDVQGEAFEGLLEKTANEGKKGAGQFFTPRPLIRAIVNVMQPDPTKSKHFKIADTSCGTGGFLTMAVDWAKKKLPKEKWIRLKNNTYYGQELVLRPFRLALMNLFLHDVRSNLLLGDSIYGKNSEKNLDCILTNPPFGTRGTIGPPINRSFEVVTSNIQINFIQHIFASLKHKGRAAIVLPDSCFTDSKATELWKRLIGGRVCNVHTILKLPHGTFNPYANGIKASVVFMQKGVPTKDVWVYDARTGIEDITKASRPLQYEKHFAEFVQSYGEDPNGASSRTESSRFKKYSLTEILDRNFHLSFTKYSYPPTLEDPLFYVDKLIVTFEQQLLTLRRLKEIIKKQNND